MVAGALRAHLKPQGFEVLLIGKDGGVKLRQERPIASETLFATIDAVKERWKHRAHVNGHVIQMNGPTMKHPSAVGIADLLVGASTRRE